MVTTTSIITHIVNTVPVLTPFDNRKPLPELGEGATVVITKRFWGNRAETVQACIEQIKPFEHEIRPGLTYRGALYGLRTDRGYQVMTAVEFKKRLVSYCWVEVE